LGTTAGEVDGLIVRGLRENDYAGAKEVIARSFEDHVDQNPGVMDEYVDEPWYDPEHLLVAEVQGRIVSQMGVRDGTLWIDGRAFPAGLVGTVCTLPEFRGNGIGAEMMRTAFTWMDKRGLALSCLHTSEARHGFYGRLGYRLSSYCQARSLVEVGERGPDIEEPEIRRAAPEDAGVLNGLYESYYGKYSGAWSRSEAFWVRRLEGKPKLWFTGEAEFWILGKEEPVAYLAVVPGAPARIVELACPSMDVPAVKGLLNHVIQRLGISELVISLSERSPLWRALNDYKVVDRTSVGNVFIRVQNSELFLGLASQLLGERAENLDLSFEIEVTDTGEVLTAEETGEKVALSLTLQELGAVIYSGGRIQELLHNGTVDLKEGKKEALLALFPENYPSRCPMDGY
jgi:predicted acetyltransferase